MPSKTPAKSVKRVTKRPQPRPEPEEDDISPDSEDEPEEREAPKMSGGQSRVRRGFTEGQRQMDSTSSYAKAFKPEEKSQVIKFLEKDPYASFRRHWIEGRNDQGQRSVRAHTCPLTLDPPEECPLCEVGDKAQAVSAFNVALIGDDGQVILRSWDVGARLFGVLKGYANDPKIGPLTKNFFIVSKTGTRNNVQYNVAPVRPSSLEEDYDIPVPDQSEFDALTPYDGSIIDITPTRKLKELAQELMTEDD